MSELDLFMRMTGMKARCSGVSDYLLTVGGGITLVVDRACWVLGSEDDVVRLEILPRSVSHVFFIEYSPTVGVA